MSKYRRTARRRFIKAITFMTSAAVLMLLSEEPHKALAQSSPSAVADVLIINGRVMDGAGGPWRQANVAITGDTITYVGRAPVKAKKTIDAAGKVVSPGFINMHSHSEFGLAFDGRGLGVITQGITTEVLGEHLSAGPVLGPAVDDPAMVTPPVRRTWTTLGGFFDFLTKKGIGPNVLSYVGVGSVRASVIGYENREPTDREMDKMKELLAQALHEGAFGLSVGLDSVPNSFSTTAELIELAKVASRMGGIYAVHMRRAGGDIVGGWRETIQIAKDAHIPTEIFHVGMNIPRNPEFVRIIEQARNGGIDVTANAYPYTASFNNVRQMLPVWAQEGNTDAITARLKQADVRARAIAEMAETPGRYAKYTVSSANQEFDGFTFQEIADKRRQTVEEAIVDFLIVEKSVGAQTMPVDSSMDQAQAEAFTKPWLDIGSDGVALPAGIHTPLGKAHPRSFGSFARILGDVVRKRQILTMEQAVQRMTSQPANRLGIADRGLLRQGMKADVVVFDPETVTDTATYERPDSYAKGINWVFINGKAVVADEKPTDALPGRVLRGPAYRPGAR